MRVAILRSINLAMLLGAVAWLARAPDWEPLVAALGFLGVIVGHEFKLHRNDGRDRALFNKFLTALPSDGGSLRFLDQQDIGAPFHSKDLDELDRFAESWSNAEHEFLDRELEKQRKRFLELLQLFRGDLSMNVSGARTNGFLTMGISDHDNRPDVWDARNRLNKLASEVHAEHQKLVRLGRRKLIEA